MPVTDVLCTLNMSMGKGFPTVDGVNLLVGKPNAQSMSGCVAVIGMPNAFCVWGADLGLTTDAWKQAFQLLSGVSIGQQSGDPSSSTADMQLGAVDGLAQALLTQLLVGQPHGDCYVPGDAFYGYGGMAAGAELWTPFEVLAAVVTGRLMGTAFSNYAELLLGNAHGDAYRNFVKLALGDRTGDSTATRVSLGEGRATAVATARTNVQQGEGFDSVKTSIGCSKGDGWLTHAVLNACMESINGEWFTTILNMALGNVTGNYTASRLDLLFGEHGGNRADARLELALGNVFGNQSSTRTNLNQGTDTAYARSLLNAQLGDVAAELSAHFALFKGDGTAFCDWLNLELEATNGEWFRLLLNAALGVDNSVRTSYIAELALGNRAGAATAGRADLLLGLHGGSKTSAAVDLLLGLWGGDRSLTKTRLDIGRASATVDGRVPLQIGDGVYVRFYSLADVAKGEGDAIIDRLNLAMQRDLGELFSTRLAAGMGNGDGVGRTSRGILALGDVQGANTRTAVCLGRGRNNSPTAIAITMQKGHAAYSLWQPNSALALGRHGLRSTDISSLVLGDDCYAWLLKLGLSKDTVEALAVYLAFGLGLGRGVYSWDDVLNLTFGNRTPTRISTGSATVKGRPNINSSTVTQIPKGKLNVPANTIVGVDEAAGDKYSSEPSDSDCTIGMAITKNWHFPVSDASTVLRQSNFTDNATHMEYDVGGRYGIATGRKGTPVDESTFLGIIPGWASTGNFEDLLVQRGLSIGKLGLMVEQFIAAAIGKHNEFINTLWQLALETKSALVVNLIVNLILGDGFRTTSDPMNLALGETAMQSGVLTNLLQGRDNSVSDTRTTVVKGDGSGIYEIAGMQKGLMADYWVVRELLQLMAEVSVDGKNHGDIVSVLLGLGIGRMQGSAAHINARLLMGRDSSASRNITNILMGGLANALTALSNAQLGNAQQPSHNVLQLMRGMDQLNNWLYAGLSQGKLTTVERGCLGLAKGRLNSISRYVANASKGYLGQEITTLAQALQSYIVAYDELFGVKLQSSVTSDSYAATRISVADSTLDELYDTMRRLSGDWSDDTAAVMEAMMPAIDSLYQFTVATRTQYDVNFAITETEQPVEPGENPIVVVPVPVDYTVTLSGNVYTALVNVAGYIRVGGPCASGYVYAVDAVPVQGTPTPVSVDIPILFTTTGQRIIRILVRFSDDTWSPEPIEVPLQVVDHEAQLRIDTIVTVSSPVRVIGLTVDPTEAVDYSVQMQLATGTFSYSGLLSAVPTVKSAVNIQGMNGIVERVGPRASRQSPGYAVEGRILPVFTSEFIMVRYPERTSHVDPNTGEIAANDDLWWYVEDILAEVKTQAGIDVTFTATNNEVVSFEFSGRFTDCLQQLADLACGDLIQQNGNWYIVPKGTCIGSFEVPVDDLISVQQQDQSDLLDTVLTLFKTRRELYGKIKDYALDMAAENFGTMPLDNISFDVGVKDKQRKMLPNDIHIDGGQWDQWTPTADNPEAGNDKTGDASLMGCYYQIRPSKWLENSPSDQMEGCHSVFGAQFLKKFSPPADATGLYYAKGKMQNVVSPFWDGDRDKWSLLQTTSKVRDVTHVNGLTTKELEHFFVFAAMPNSHPQYDWDDTMYRAVDITVEYVPEGMLTGNSKYKKYWLEAKAKMACIDSELTRLGYGELIDDLDAVCLAWWEYDRAVKLNDTLANIAEKFDAAKDLDLALTRAVVALNLHYVAWTIDYLYDNVMPLPGQALTLSGSIHNSTVTTNCGRIETVSFSGFKVTLTTKDK